MVVKKTKISTITAAIATIAIIAALGSMGGGIGLGQQQMALAQPVDPRDIRGEIEDIVSGILEDDDDDGGVGELLGNNCLLEPESITCQNLQQAVDIIADVNCRLVAPRLGLC
jgi:hypothetical protein